MGVRPFALTGKVELFPQEWIDRAFGQERENMNIERVSGTEIAGNPYDAVQQVVEILRGTQIEPHMLRDFNTFEQTIVATFVRQLHLMVQKQRGYGKANIAMLKSRGILKRIEEKVLRGYEEIGDPEIQLEKIKELQASLDDEATPSELATHMRKIDAILNPGGSNEDTADNLFLDIGNLGQIGYVEFNGAWGKPLEERLPADAEIVPGR